MSLHLFRSLISFISVLVKHTGHVQVLFALYLRISFWGGAMVNGIIKKISVINCLLLVHRNSIDFSMLTLCPET